MHLLFKYLIGLLALVLLAASFLYLFNPDRAKRLLQKPRPSLLIVFVVVLAVAIWEWANFLEVGIGAITLSVIAYFVRKRGNSKSEKRHGFGGAERTPVLPIVTRTRDDEDTESTS